MTTSMLKLMLSVFLGSLKCGELKKSYSKLNIKQERVGLHWVKLCRIPEGIDKHEFSMSLTNYNRPKGILLLSENSNK